MLLYSPSLKSGQLLDPRSRSTYQGSVITCSLKCVMFITALLGFSLIPLKMSQGQTVWATGKPWESITSLQEQQCFHPFDSWWNLPRCYQVSYFTPQKFLLANVSAHTYRYSLTEETEADSVTVVVTGGRWACSSRRVRCTECGCGRTFLRILNAEPVPVAPRLTIGSWLPLCAAHLFAWVLSIGSFFFIIYFYLLIYFCAFAHFYCIHLCVQFSFVLVLDMYSPVVWLCGAGWFVSCDAQTNGVSFICCRLEDICSLAFYGEPTPGHMVS